MKFREKGRWNYCCRALTEKTVLMPVVKEENGLQDIVDDMDSKKNAAAKTKECLLPLNRIRIIMKSSPETENIGQDALFLVARTTVGTLQHGNDIHSSYTFLTDSPNLLLAGIFCEIPHA